MTEVSKNWTVLCGIGTTVASSICIELLSACGAWPLDIKSKTHSHEEHGGKWRDGVSANSDSRPILRPVVGLVGFHVYRSF